MKRIFFALLSIVLAGCVSRPEPITETDRPRASFELGQQYDSVAGLAKFVISVKSGVYIATYKDSEGVYYMQPGSTGGVYVTKDYSEAWIFSVTHKPNGGGAFPYNTMPEVAELLFPPGGTLKVRRLKPDFLEKIRWKEEPNQPLQRNVSTGSVSSLESPARRG